MPEILKANAKAFPNFVLDGNNISTNEQLNRSDLLGCNTKRRNLETTRRKVSSQEVAYA